MGVECVTRHFLGSCGAVDSHKEGASCLAAVWALSISLVTRVQPSTDTAAGPARLCALVARLIARVLTAARQAVTDETGGRTPDPSSLLACPRGERILCP